MGILLKVIEKSPMFIDLLKVLNIKKFLIGCYVNYHIKQFFNFLSMLQLGVDQTLVLIVALAEKVIEPNHPLRECFIRGNASLHTSLHYVGTCLPVVGTTQ